MAAQEAAVLLVPQGDYLGALDVLAELQAALDSGLLHGLTAFWALPAQLAHFRQVQPTCRSQMLHPEPASARRWP